MEAALPNGDIHLEVDNHDNREECLTCHKPVSIADIKSKIGSGLEFSKNIENINCKPDCDPIEGQLDVKISRLDINSKETSDELSEQDLNSLIPSIDDHGDSKCEAAVSEEDECNSSSSNSKDECADKESQQLEKPVSVPSPIRYEVYKSEEQMPDIMQLITKDLSEPYSVYTYRYFIHNWPKLCFLAIDGAAEKETGQEKCVGAIVCKLDMHKNVVRRGYIAMLAVDHSYRRRKIGSHLVMKAIKAMVADNCDEVVLETEITNKPALRLYENLGFVRDKRLFRYYLNGVDALRLKLWLR